MTLLIPHLRDKRNVAWSASSSFYVLRLLSCPSSLLADKPFDLTQKPSTIQGQPRRLAPPCCVRRIPAPITGFFTRDATNQSLTAIRTSPAQCDTLRHRPVNQNNQRGRCWGRSGTWGRPSLKVNQRLQSLLQPPNNNKNPRSEPRIPVRSLPPPITGPLTSEYRGPSLPEPVTVTSTNWQWTGSVMPVVFL